MGTRLLQLFLLFSSASGDDIRGGRAAFEYQDVWRCDADTFYNAAAQQRGAAQTQKAYFSSFMTRMQSSHGFFVLKITETSTFSLCFLSSFTSVPAASYVGLHLSGTVNLWGQLEFISKTMTIGMFVVQQKYQNETPDGRFQKPV